MKKIITFLVFAIITHTTVFAQATLPTAWSFASPSLPTGWTQNGTLFYTASGHTPPACKFDNTGDSLTIHFGSNPGTLTYYLTGNSFTGGTFDVNESADGSSWTSLHSFTAPPSATYTLYTDVPNIATRYIRFVYTLKVTGNIGLDDVNIDAGPAGPQQEINIKQGTTTILSGGTFVPTSPVSTMTPITFTVENLGTTSSLTVGTTTISGANAADFSVGSTPATVAASSSGNLVINFTPGAAGTRIASLSIVNDDADENPYIINLYGVGGTFATEPSAQPTNLVFSNVKSYRYDGSFTGTSPAPDGYIVLKKVGSAVTDIPVDGTLYQRGDIVGNSTVAYCGTATNFGSGNIESSTNYNYAIFPFNGPGNYRNYLTTSPLTGSVTSSGTMVSTSTMNYTGVSSTASTFVTDLHAKVNPHTAKFYSDYGPIMVTLFHARDTVDDQKVLTCVYSGENKVYSEPFDWTTVGYSREHSYCQSWMPTVNDPGFTNRPEYSDFHFLTPVDQTGANAPRSNNPYGEVVGAPTYTFNGCKMGNDANGHLVFEPRDEDKGDAARAVFYECICYTGVAYSGPANTNVTYGGSWSLPSRISGSIPYGQDQNILKKWHFQDLPDKWEIARNDFVDSVQHNRNPFIDSVDWVCHIDFSTMTWVTNPGSPCYSFNSGISEKQNSLFSVRVSPNPSTGRYLVESIGMTQNNRNTVRVVDVMGKEIYFSDAVNFPMSLDLQGQAKGIYFLEIKSGSERKFEKLIRE